MAAPSISLVTTANAAIGTGHLRRCLALADALRQAGSTLRFFVVEGDPALCDWVRPYADAMAISRDLTLPSALAQAGVDPLVVVDSYAVRADQTQRLLNGNTRVLVMDDLVDRPLPATWLLNSCVADAERYAGLTHATLLMGPRYALLRAQFRNLPRRSPSGPVRRVLLTFGGSDVLRLADRVVNLFASFAGPLEIRLVAGRLAGTGALHAGPHRIDVLHDVAHMADLMTWADLAVATAGQTIFELAATGCPAICLQVADNQRYTGELCRRIGSAEIRDARRVTDRELVELIRNLLNDPIRRAAMSRAGQAAVDGLGAMRVSDVLLEAA
ncbi:MAG TPA: UDP-2,4-diacetamido-2,4,6-trideoxy-beta-L-altropyranose hydrolase [Kiritimatiellia bacterium]|nr:UDP-2,4-diacetamido-2,4,6-trideoxy-beta-L-altropyranose hydrolase [Kiritimatiellia bacterium]